MLYVATVHFRSTKWIDIQHRYLHRTIAEPFRTFATLDGIPARYEERFDRVVPADGSHAGKLNLLAAEIVHEAAPDDIVMFLDGDAFPIADPVPAVRRALADTSLLAVRRDENSADEQPHPCFCAVRVSEWERLHGDWSKAAVWTDPAGAKISDVGGNLLAALERTGSEWTPLLRSNVRNLDPLWFAVYGDIVYHHGAGFRRPRSRAALEERPFFLRGGGLPVVGEKINEFNRRRTSRYMKEVMSESEELSDRVFAQIEADPEFFRILLDIDATSELTDVAVPADR